METVIREDFEVKIFVFRNPFTKEKMEKALTHLLVEKHIKNVILDGKKSCGYTLRLKKVLRESGIPVKKVDHTQFGWSGVLINCGSLSSRNFSGL